MNVIRRGGEPGWSGEWESGTGRNGGISFSSYSCWGWGCEHVGEAMYRRAGSGEWEWEWEGGSRGDDGAVVAGVYTPKQLVVRVYLYPHIHVCEML